MSKKKQMALASCSDVYPESRDRFCEQAGTVTTITTVSRRGKEKRGPKEDRSIHY
jgi:hypothetical protein